MNRKTFFSQRRQMPTFLLARLTDRHASANDGAAAVSNTVGQYLLVQCVQIARLRHWHKQVTPEPSQLTFDAAFFVATGGVTVLTLIAPVRPERNDPIRLHSLVAAQNLLHHGLHVVIPQGLENTAKIGKRMFVGFKQSLLRGVRISPMRSEEHTSELQS